MIKIFIPQDKTQGKTDVRGLWINNTGKIYYDYIKIYSYNTPYIDRLEYCFAKNSDFLKKLSELKNKYNQEANFYTCGGKAYIYYNDNKIDILKHKIFITVPRTELKKCIKYYLKLYGGITIYINSNKTYSIEAWYNKKKIHNTKTKRQAKKHKLIKKLFNNILQYTDSIKHKEKIKFRISYNKHDNSYCCYRKNYINDTKYCIISLNLANLNSTIKSGYKDDYYAGRGDYINPLINNNRHNAIRFVLLHELKHAIDYLSDNYNLFKFQREYSADKYAIDKVRNI